MRSLFLFISLIISTSLFSQDTLISKKRILSAVQFGVGFRTDVYNNMSFEKLSATAKNPNALYRNIDGFSEDIGVKSHFVSIYFHAIVTPKYKTNNNLFNKSEWQLGLGYHSAGELRIGYDNEVLDSTILFCNISSELTLDAAYLIKWPIDNKITVACGAGTSASMLHNNEMMVQEGPFLEEGAHPRFILARPENTATYKAKSLLYFRPFLAASAHIRRTKKIRISIQYRYGIGFQYVPQHGLNFLQRSSGLIVGVRRLIL